MKLIREHSSASREVLPCRWFVYYEQDWHESGSPLKREPSLPVFAALREQPSISRPIQVSPTALEPTCAEASARTHNFWLACRCLLNS